jgi:hypothetical protein
MNKGKTILCMTLVAFISLIGSSSTVAAKIEESTLTPKIFKIKPSPKFKMPLLQADNCDPKIFITGNFAIDPKFLINLSNEK